MSLDAIFTVLLAIVVAAVLAFVALSGMLSAGARSRVERVMAWVFYPLFVVFWGWRALEFGGDGSWFGAALMVLVAAAFAWQGYRAIRQGRLVPGASK